MSPQILLVFAILLVTMLLFITERLSVDLVALLVLVSLALTGLVDSNEAISGFSSPAVVTVWAVFVLSGGLARTGVAAWIGHQVLRMAGAGETRLVVVIMLTAAAMSAFMNNVGVAALLLPVVMDVARRTGRAPARLLLPLAYGSLLGGLNTLIGTPPNILVSEGLISAGLEPFGMFDFARLGLPVTLVGVAYMVLIGSRLLPDRDIARASMPGESAGAEIGQRYGLADGLRLLRIPPGSALDGRRLDESRLGTALGMTALAILRKGERSEVASRHSRLRAGVRLVVAGPLDRLEDLRHWQRIEKTAAESGSGSTDLEALMAAPMALAELELSATGEMTGRTLRQLDFRARFGLNVLAIAAPAAKDARVAKDVPAAAPSAGPLPEEVDGRSLLRRTDLQDIPLEAGARLLVHGQRSAIAALAGDAAFARQRILDSAEAVAPYRLEERLMRLRVPEGSSLDGASLAEIRLGHAFDLVVLGIVHAGRMRLAPGKDERLEGGDTLIIEGREEDLALVAGLQSLETESGPLPSLDALESDGAGLAEVILSPYTERVGATLRELRFREKYELSVLAIWRGGQVYHRGIADLPLRLGDALLLHGPYRQLQLLGAEPDFVVLSEAAQEAPRAEKAGLATAIMVAVLLPVILGWVPIAIAAVGGAAAMVLTGCLTMDEAYRYIEWKAVFLIAGLLPLGIAMERSGATRLVAEAMVSTLQPWGWAAVVGGLFLLTNLATQIMPNPAVALLMAPIAIGAAGDLGMSPYALMMVVAVASSAALMSPVGHPANVLVMGPGGYRFRDYLRVGLPLTLVMLLLLLLILPLAWPLY